jgi:FkbM family methyltransferase
VAAEPQSNLAAAIIREHAEPILAGRLVVLELGLDASPGHRTMSIARDSSMSSMSADFIRISRENGDKWLSGALEITTTTLDAMILEFGLPVFCKIDVEGMDYDVLRGLSHAIRAISFEYNTQPGLIDVGLHCVARLEELGEYEYNYEIGNGYHLAMPEWLPADDMKRIMSDHLSSCRIFGDVLARLRYPRNSTNPNAEAPACH